MENQLSSVVRWHFKVFRFFGFCPFSIRTNARPARSQEHLWTIWSIIVSTFFNFLFFIYFQKYTYSWYHNDSFGFIVDRIRLVTGFLTLQVSILEPLFKRKHERFFWTQYIRLSSVRQLSAGSFWTRGKEYKHFLVKFYSFAFMSLFLEMLVLVTVQSQTLVQTLLLLSFVPYFLRLRVMKLIFCMDLIYTEIQSLDKDLQLLVEYTEFGMRRETFPKFDEFIRLRIVEKQRTYEDIFEMVESFKTANGLSIIGVYLQCCVQVLVSCYWLYWTWYNSYLTIKDILLIPAILEIPMFLLTAKNCMNAAKYIQYRVHNLKHSADNIATSIQIQNFSLQLLHQKIKIDGLGISSMDGYMLTKAVGSITTYMVFFIQFMPKFKPKYE